jgi:hypothetical protein
MKKIELLAHTLTVNVKLNNGRVITLGKIMIKLYLDMDGVVANFMKEYRAYAHSDLHDREKFRKSVMEYKIFEKLEKMPHADLLLHRVSIFDPRWVQIEMLTSMGTHRTEQGAEAKRQKLAWLKKHGITYKANFTRNKEEKSLYATPTSILIDDSIGCIEPFVAKGGLGILHKDENIQKTLNTLDSYILQLRAKYV